MSEESLKKGVKSPYQSSAGLRLPPQDIDAEKALLGSIMLKPEMMMDVRDIIKPGYFYADKHNTVFESMCTLHDQGDPIDLLTLTSKLKDKGKIDKVGGSAYLTELVNAVPSAANCLHYAQIVRQKSTLRELIYAADHISEMSYNEESLLEDILDKAGKKILDIASYSRSKFISIKDSLAEAWTRLERLHESKDELRGIPTGFKDLDHKLAGLQKADLIILAARPSVGKTSLALDIARQTALQHGTRVGIFSLEMSSQQLVDRMLSAQARVDSWKLRTGKLSTDEEFGLIRDALDKLSEAPIYIYDDSYTDVNKMRATARKQMYDTGLDLIIVDYLQLMVPHRNIDSLVQQVTEISRALKGLARELDVPVLALSQLNRQVEQRGGKPRLADLRDSGSIEQDADVVMFIHRENNEDTGRSSVSEIMIEKHRNGPTGKVELYFDDKHASFSSIQKTDFGEF